MEAVGLADLAPLQFSTGADGEAVRGRLQAVFRTKTDAEWDAFFKNLDCAVEIGM